MAAEKLEQAKEALIEAAIFSRNEERVDEVPVAAAQGTPPHDNNGTQQLNDDDAQHTQEYGIEPADDEDAALHDPPPDVDDDQDGPSTLMAGIIAAENEGAVIDNDDQPRPLRQRIEEELERYLAEPPLDTRAKLEDVLKYWFDKKPLYPTVSRTAMSYLACPMSSVTSERMFSLAGNILTKKRCAMNPDTLNKLAIIKVNRKYLNKS